MDYVRHSPSALNLFASCLPLFVLEKVLGRRQPVGPPAHRGTAVEAGIAAGLTDLTLPVQDCVDVALSRFGKLTAFSTDPRRDEFSRTIPAMVEAGLSELRPYGTPSSMQGFVEWHPEGLRYPIVGYHDFLWEQHGLVLDLKTTGALPSQVKPAHARQCALYSGGNLEARIAYVTPKKQAVYRVDNVLEHRAALLRMALACERFLSLSDDPDFYVGITVPDLESFFFAPPEARAAAYAVWGV